MPSKRTVPTKVRAEFGVDKLGEGLAAQFDAYEPIEGLHVNGQLTKGENIGDLAGVAISYKAYIMSLEGKSSAEIDGFTGEQRFFMGHAQAWRSLYREDRLRSQILSETFGQKSIF